MVGGGSGGIASARRAAEFGVKVEHNKSGNNSEECFPLSKFVYIKKKRYRRFYLILSEFLSLGGTCWGKPLGRHLRQCGMRPQEVDVVRSQVSRFCEASIKITKFKWKPMSAFLDSRLRIWKHTICIFRTVWRQQCFISAQKTDMVHNTRSFLPSQPVVNAPGWLFVEFFFRVIQSKAEKAQYVEKYSRY